MPGGATEFSAYDIGTLVGQIATTYDEGTPAAWNTEYWYTFTPTADGCIGCKAFLTAGTTYLPGIVVYYGTPGSLTSWMFISGSEPRPATIPTMDGETLYILVIGNDNLGSTSGSQLRVQFYNAPLTTGIPEGAIFIPNEVAFEYPASSGEYIAFPGAVLSPTSGTVRKHVIHMPASESGDVIPDGTVLLEDVDIPDQVYLLRPDLTIRALVTVPVSVATNPSHHITRADDDSFLVATNDGSTPTVWSVDREGTIGGTTWALPNGPAGALAYDAGLEIAYYSTGASNTIVRRYDIAGSAPLSDLAAGITGYIVRNDSIVVLEDSTILVGYYKSSAPKDAFVRRYNPDGSTVQTYELGALNDLLLDRIFRTIDESEYGFGIWFHQFISPNETSVFRFVDIDSGGTIDEFQAYQANIGIGPYIEHAPRWGHSFSCPVMQLPGEDCDCEDSCPPEPEFGGGIGKSGGEEGDDPTRLLMPYVAECAFGGTVPTGTNGSDTENWAS